MDILLVEDQKDLAELLKLFLENAGYKVIWAESGEIAMDYLSRQSVRLVLLDVGLPGMDGFAVCSQIRKLASVPVVILSARTRKEEKLLGFELGADDYVEKPVDPDILTAKVSAILKRNEAVDKQEKLLYSGSLTIDTEARLVYLKGEKIECNSKEYELLLLFVKNPGKTLHKDYLFETIWGAYSESENQTLTVHIKMLRNKIEDNAREPKRIKTVWGVGYRYEEI